MKKLRLPISIQISIFLIIAVFVPVAAMMMLKTYEIQLLKMTENSNVQQARILASSLSASFNEENEFTGAENSIAIEEKNNANSSISSSLAKEILINMEGNFDCRIRILDPQGKLLADSSNLEKSQEEYVAETESRNSESVSSSEKSNKEPFVYKIFSIPVRIYRKFKAPSAVYSNADFYSKKTVYDGEEIKAAMEGHYGAKTRISSGGQISVTLYSAVPVLKNEKVIGIVLVSRSTWRILQNIYELRTDLGKIFLWSLLVVILTAVFLSFRISLPLKKLAKETSECADKKGHIDSEKIKQFTGIKRNDEIGDLSRSFKTLINKLDSKIRYTQAFSSDVNHEFKNPLAAIRSSAELLKDELSEKERINFSTAIIDEITHLEQLLTEVRNISKIEGTNTEEQSEEIPLYDFAANIISRIKKNYQNVQIELLDQENNPPNKPTAKINPDYLEIILTNLIDNAASFAKHIQVLIKNQKLNDNKQELLLIVADNGKGIEESEYEKIFDRFYSNRPDSNSGHTGLGLSIVKAIVDATEGEIKVQKSSKLGGAEFTVNIPL